jgi:hypothetical protein
MIEARRQYSIMQPSLNLTVRGLVDKGDVLPFPSNPEQGLAPMDKWPHFITALNSLAAVFAFLSAIFWFWASIIKIPWPAMNAYGGPAPIVMQQLNRQTVLNSRAALFAGLSATAQAVALLLPQVMH